MKKIKFLTALLISLLPANFLRVFFYKIIFGYKIYKSYIGWLTILSIKELNITQASIGGFNIFSGPFSVEMQKASSIGHFNFFKGGSWASNNPYYEQSLIIKENVLITDQHYFDVNGTIYIGSNSFIAGVRSQFWTHGSLKNNTTITIGQGSYIGSGCKFAPGSGVGAHSLVALGAIVSKNFSQENALIGGNPAKLIKENINWRELWV